MKPITPVIIADPPPPPAEAPATTFLSVHPMKRSAQGTETQRSTVAALRGATPPQYMSVETRSFEPSAGYIGKKTLKRKSITLSWIALPRSAQSRACQGPKDRATKYVFT